MGLCVRCLLQLASESPEVAEPDPPQTVPRFLGDYELLEEVARGGMGIVYKARQPGLNRMVAIKVLHSGRFANEAERRRFRAEATAAARLHHPNVVPVHGIGEQDGLLYFSMAYIEGPTLGMVLRNGPIPPKRAVEYLRNVTKAVELAHKQGILHRDLKPSNILIDPFDQPQVTDFGLSRELHVDSTLTLEGQTLGSPNYLPPEQISSGQASVGPASDLYSLGAILYHSLTGRPPFAAGTVAETLIQVSQSDPPPPRLLNPALPRDLETICLKCLEKDPTDRYSDASSLLMDLELWLAGKPIYARPLNTAERSWRWVQRNRALTISVTLVVLTLLVSGLVSRRFWLNSKANQESAHRATGQFKAQQIQSEILHANEELASGNLKKGVPWLASIVQEYPTNLLATRRLLSVLTSGNLPRPISPPLQHSEAVDRVLFSPDGKWILVKGDGMEVTIWESHGSNRLASPLHFDAEVRAVAIAPDSLRVAAGTVDGEIAIWNPVQPEGIRRIRLGAATTSMQFAPAEKRLCCAFKNGRIVELNSENAAILREYPSSTHAASEVRYSPDGRWIAASSLDGTNRVWDCSTGLLFKSLPGTNSVNGIQWNTSGTALLTYNRTSVKLWEFPSCQSLLQIAPPDSTFSAELSPDGTRIVTGGYDRTARLWNAKTGQPIGEPMKHRYWVGHTRFSPDGRRILTSSYDGTARLWNALDGTPDGPIMAHQWWVFDASFSPDGQTIATASMDRTARLWSSTSGNARPRTILPPDRVAVWRLSPNGATIAAVSNDQELQLLDAADGKTRSKLRLESKSAHQLDFSPNSELVAVFANREVRTHETKSGAPIGQPMEHPDTVKSLAFGSGSDQLATACQDGLTRIWNPTTGRLLREVPPLPEPSSRTQIESISLSRDGQWLAEAHADFRIHLYHLVENRLSATVQHDGPIFRTQFIGKGDRILTLGMDNLVILWETETGKRIHEYRHGVPIISCSASPNEQTLATALDDGSAWLWQLERGLLHTAPLRHTRTATASNFSPDGMELVTASWDGTIRLWDVATGMPLSEPLIGGGAVNTARFHPDGKSIWAFTAVGGLQKWGHSPNASIAPRWLTELAEAVVEQRLSRDGMLEGLPPKTLEQLRAEFSSKASGDDPYSRWLRWFLSDPATRPGSPFDPIRVTPE